MELQKDQEVWVRVKIKDSAQHKERVWGVVLEDHLSPSPQPHNMFVHEKDIFTTEALADVVINENERLKKLDQEIEELFLHVQMLDHSHGVSHGKGVGGAAQQVEFNTGQIQELLKYSFDLEERLEFADIRALDAQERVAALENELVDYQQLIDRICQLERDIETHNEVITRLQDEWKRQHGGFDASKEPPTDRYSLCRVCDKPIGYGQLYCYDHAPLIRTGEAMISADEQKRGSENPKDLPKVINTMDDL